MNAGKDYRMGESIVPSAHLREVKAQGQNKTPKEPMNEFHRAFTPKIPHGAIQLPKLVCFFFETFFFQTKKKVLIYVKML